MRKGFTLIEVLVTIVILFLIAAFGLTVSARSYRRGSIDSERDALRGALEKARSQAMANMNQSPHGFAVTDGGFVVFQGESYEDREEDMDQIIPRTSGFIVDGPSEIVFRAIEGSVPEAETFTVQNEVKTLSVGVNQEGRIEW